MYEGKHIYHLGVGGEQFPGMGQNDRHHLIIIIAGFVVVVSFFLQVGKIRAYPKT